jgi:ssDNA-binding Zn-finger/Zn-ribbon topoisomerase 1
VFPEKEIKEVEKDRHYIVKCPKCGKELNLWYPECQIVDERLKKWGY